MADLFRFDITDEILTRAAWSRIAEPGDSAATILVQHLGPGAALRWLTRAMRGPDAADGAISELLGGEGTECSGLQGRPGARRLATAIGRWRVRTDDLDPGRDLRFLSALGGRLLIPGSAEWPTGLDDLGPGAPLCLWARGAGDLGARPAVALVGCRASSDYGNHVAVELACGLADRGLTIISGGAYGIDAAAHRGALAAGRPTVAFLAGGIDRLYPAGNADLLRSVCENGALLSEVPPGSVPRRTRFLARNRLIAAAAEVTVVVEAAWRSGALSTAARAAELARPVAAVPGPVTAPSSAGCHRLLRDGAVCVTSADEVAELIGPIGSPACEPVAPGRVHDGLDPVELRTWEALPLRRGINADSLARTAGLTLVEVLAGLGRLEVQGLAVRVDGLWRRP